MLERAHLYKPVIITGREQYVDYSHAFPACQHFHSVITSPGLFSEYELSLFVLFFFRIHIHMTTQLNSYAQVVLATPLRVFLARRVVLCSAYKLKVLVSALPVWRVGRVFQSRHKSARRTMMSSCERLSLGGISQRR